MRSLKCKCLLVMIAAVFSVMAAAGFSEAAQRRSRSSRKSGTPSKAAQKNTPAKNSVPRASRPAPVITSDDIIGEQMLKLAEALRKTSQLEHGIPSSEIEREKLYEQYDAQIAELERQIADIELKKDALLEAGVSDDEQVEAELSDIEKNVDDISDVLYMSFDVMPEYIYAFHPQAKSQIVSWELSQDVNTEVEMLALTILHNRDSQRITRLTIPSELTESGDIFFTVKDLPEDVQIVIPKGTGDEWTVTADGRVGNGKIGNKGYYVAEIVDPDDIAYSELDGESNITGEDIKTF